MTLHALVQLASVLIALGVTLGTLVLSVLGSLTTT